MFIEVDMNRPNFQAQLFDLIKSEQNQLLSSLRKITNMTWTQLYADHGLKWEALHDKQFGKTYTFRFSQKYRAVAAREGNYLRLIRLCVDHDSAYK